MSQSKISGRCCTSGSVTEQPYGPFKWTGLILATIGTIIALVFDNNGWLGPALGYAINIGMVCSPPMGRIFGPHARLVQLTGGLLIIALSIVLIRRGSSSPDRTRGAGSVTACLTNVHPAGRPDRPRSNYCWTSRPRTPGGRS